MMVVTAGNRLAATSGPPDASTARNLRPHADTHVLARHKGFGTTLPHLQRQQTPASRPTGKYGHE